MYILTSATTKLLKLKKRIRGIAGGTSAGKTVSIEQILIDKAQTDTAPTLTSIVSETLPHLKKGAIRDFLSIMQVHRYFRDDCWNKTDFIYTFETGSQIEFFSADQPSKVRGPRRHRLFINEGNNIPYETFDQLEVRTTDEIWIDWNPTCSFWFYEDLLPSRGEDVDFLTLTYKDNEALDPRIVRAIESRRDNVQWWRVYGEGQLGQHEGLIFTNWEIIDSVPEDARLYAHGLDFGYTNDPTAIVGLYAWNGGDVLDEELYQTGMKNREIANFLKTLPRALVVADSSEPKSIDEIHEHGIDIVGAEKGPGSVNQGIQYLQGRKLYITKRSVNGIKELRNYSWLTDRNGRQLNQPQDMWNHFCDAARYGSQPKPMPTFRMVTF